MKNKKVIAIAVVIVVVIVAIIIGVAVKVSNKAPEPTPGISQDISEDVSEIEEKEPAVIPVDLDKWMTDYPDIYAWIAIPGTPVDNPIVQSPEGESDDYYLRLTLDKKEATAGTIYTQRSLNAQDFSDNVTVIYGHNMRNKSMFGILDSYATEDFRKEHSQIYIYTPGKVYTYELAFAVTYSDAHILYNYDCNNDVEGYQEFLDSLNNQQYSPKWINEDIQLTTDDKIIVLSTCNSVDTQRYLVGAKLVSVEDGVYVPQETTEE